VKDRVALRSEWPRMVEPCFVQVTCQIVIDDAERLGLLRPHTGSRIFEGTSGSTGISLALIARARCDIC